MKLKKAGCLILSLLICAAVLAPLSILAVENTDEHLVFHYNFQGSTPAERLANRVAGSDTGSLTLSTKDNKSYVEDGYAFVDQAMGEYLSVAVGNDVKSIKNTATLFLSFRYHAPKPNNAGDAAQIGSTVRVALNTNGTIFTRMGEGITSKAATQLNVRNPVTAAGSWVRIAVTMEFDEAGNVKEIVYLSADDGASWEKTELTLGGDTAALKMFAGNSMELLLGKVSKTIADRGFSFYFRDVRLYDRILTENEIKAISLKAVTVKEPDAPVVTPDPTDPADPNRNMSDHLVVHYDFLGSTKEEMLKDKATAGNSAEDLMMYSSITDGVKDSYIGEGKVYISSKQSNCLFAIAGEDIKGIQKSMTAFIAFTPSWESRSNPGDFLAIDNNLRFGLHNANDQLFSGVGTSFAGAGPSTGVSGGVGKNGKPIYAAITVIWDGDTDKVLMTLHYSTDEGATWASTASRVATDIPTMYSNATYLVFGKNNPGMENRGTDFLYDDIRIYNCALTLDEIKTIEVEAYDADRYPPVTDDTTGEDDTTTSGEDGTTTPEENETTTPEENETTAAPDETTATEKETAGSSGSEVGTNAAKPASKGGCNATASVGICLILGVAACAVGLGKHRK